MKGAFRTLGDGLFAPTLLSVGPWSPHLAHGGPPSGLAAQKLHEAGVTLFGSASHLSRLTVALARPVRIPSVVRVAVESVSVGKNSAHLTATISNAEDLKALFICTGLVVKTAPMTVPYVSEKYLAPKRAADSEPIRFWDKFAPEAYDDLVEMRLAEGELGNSRHGPTAVWMRMVHRLIEGENPERLCGMAQVAVLADSANGIAMTLSQRDYTFANSDLSISLFRAPRTEWVCLRAKTHVTEHGTGMVDAQLFDEDGMIGRATQNQVISQRNHSN